MIIDGVFNLADLDGTNGFVIRGVDNNDNSGRSVSSAGDINGDGIDDLIIGAPNASSSNNYSSEGESYVVFGSSDGFNGTLELSDLDGNNGFVIRGIDNNDNSGRSVSSAGDINGDGIDDLIIGAPYADVNGNYSDEGESYVVFGSSDGFNGTLELSDLDGNNGFVLRGIDNYDNSGRSVSSAGDINGDGIDDLIIGSLNASSSGNYSREGESYVVFGSSDGFDATLELSDLNGNNGFVIRGIDNYDASGYSVSSAGDINGDGIDDLIIGTPNASSSNNYSGEGESYVVFGSSDGFDATLELSDLDGNNGFVIRGIDNYDNSGRSVSSAGDINGDGIDDLIIGAPYANSSGNYSREGESYVVFGRSEGFDGTLELSDLDGNNGFVIRGIDNYDNSGYSVSGAGDVNGDGIDDLIIGTPNADVSSNYSGEGESYVVFGSSDGFDTTLELSDLDGNNGFVLRGIDNNDNSGRSVSGAGDINGDGVDDFIIGAPNASSSNNYSGEGESYVIFGIKPLDLTGTNGDDVLSGENGNDIISGLNGNDTILGESGNDTIQGGSGNDFILGGNGFDDIQGNSGTDNIIGEQGNDSISGGDGQDTIFGGNGSDNIQGGSGADNIFGQEDSDTIFGGNGQDTISGGDGNDQIRGGSGKDYLEGNQGNDIIAGGFGRDTIDGGDGDDDIQGNSGADIISGGAGNDLLHGGAGKDRLSGVDISTFGVGEMDTLKGGAGKDIFVLGNAEAVFYDDGDALTTGEDDFALVRDFNERRDVIELRGELNLYRLDFFSSGAGSTNAALIYDPGVSARGELIAILEDVSEDLSLSDGAFSFVV